MHRPGRGRVPFRSPRRCRRRPPLPREQVARPARARHALRYGLCRVARTPEVRVAGAFGQRLQVAPAGHPGFFGRPRFPQERAERAREGLAGRLRQGARGRMAGAAPPQPARVAGGRVARAGGRRIRRPGRQPAAARAAGPAHQHPQDQAGRRAGGLAGRGIESHSHGALALGRAPGGQALAGPLARVREWRARGAGRRLAIARTAARCQARRDGGGLLRRRRRQDPGHRRHHAQHRPPLRLRHLGAPARRAQAPPGPQRPVQRAPGGHRARARRAHQAPGRQDRPRAGGRAVFGPGHTAPQPRSEMAPDAADRGGAGGPSARHPGERGAPAQAGRATGLRHLQPAARGERRCRRDLQRRATRLRERGRRTASAGAEGARCAVLVRCPRG